MEKHHEDTPKTGIKCQYGGRKMRSALEMRLAKLLDKLEIEWEYEPEYFTLKKGEITYLPDFKLKNRKVFIEVKGVYKKEDEQKIERFVKETENELILVNSKLMEFVRTLPKTQQIEYSNTHLIDCKKCGEYGFVPNLGSWHCRNCSNHNGDRDIQVHHLLSQDSAYIKAETLRLTNQETIENWFETIEEQ